MFGFFRKSAPPAAAPAAPEKGVADMEQMLKGMHDGMRQMAERGERMAKVRLALDVLAVLDAPDTAIRQKALDIVEAELNT